MNEEEKKGKKQLTGNVTHLVIVKYRLSSLITSHICYRVIVETIMDSTGEGKAHASSVSLAYW